VEARAPGGLRRCERRGEAMRWRIPNLSRSGRVLASAIALVTCCFAVCAWAQDATTVQQGTTFANTLAPASASQVVNPTAVNATAWSSSTSTPTAVPSNLGGFSSPNTTSTAYTTAQSSSLTAIGQQAVVNCANYVPGPNSDPLQTQACAAVNFMTNQCLTPTTAEASVMAGLGTTQQPSGNCSGTYGQGAQAFGFGNQVTASDPIFSAMNTLNQTAGQTVGQTCTTQSVVTTPAQYATETCVKNGTTTSQTCSQILNVAIVTTRTGATQTDICPTGTLVGSYCESTSATNSQPTYVCPSGLTLQGDLCVGPNISIPAIVASYTCPSGQTLAGSTCVSQVNTDDGSATGTDSCPPGATLSGTLCTATTTGSPTFPPSAFCQDGYGNIPVVWSISGSVCSIQWAAGDPVTTKAANFVTGCPGLNDFTTMIAGIRINTVQPYSDGNCEFVTDYGANGQMYCPLPDPTHFALQNQTGLAPVPGYGVTSTNVCSYVPATNYSCPAGETLDANNQCYGGTTTTAIVSSYFCPTGGAYVNGQCVTTTVANAIVTYSCPTADTLVGTECMKTTVVTVPATPVYSCPAGDTLSGTTCTGPGATSAATLTYTCPNGGTLSGNMCVTTTTVPATIQYSCIDGSAPIAGFCVIKSAQSSWTDTCGAYETSAGTVLPLP
jgi:hypothetical protein